MSVFIIAEAGVNHNGSLSLAKKLVDVAKEAGADCVKFQTFIAENIVSKSSEKADYQKQFTDVSESQYDMLKKLELSFDDFIELSDYCKMKEIEFLSTAFDIESVAFLSNIGMQRWKIPSGDITNLPYLIEIAKLNSPVILSTGMCSIEDIECAINVLHQHGVCELTVLHCTTEYPAPFEDINLKAMSTIQKLFNVTVGYSDHTSGIEVAIAAVALGANVIEKHFTLDCSMVGPDHKASIEPHELKAMVSAIRHIEKALGDGNKKITSSELKNLNVVRKSVVAKHTIKKGELFSEENLTTKRPGNGISPMQWYELIGRKAVKDFEKDELIIL